MPFTLSFGRSIADVRVTGSVTSKPSIHSADSCGRVPPMRSSPSRPRTTPGADCACARRGAPTNNTKSSGVKAPQKVREELYAVNVVWSSAKIGTSRGPPPQRRQQDRDRDQEIRRHPPGAGEREESRDL